jgi:hypothetical protein
MGSCQKNMATLDAGARLGVRLVEHFVLFLEHLDAVYAPIKLLFHCSSESLK